MDNQVVLENNIDFSANVIDEHLLDEINKLQSPFTWIPDRSLFSSVDPNFIIENNIPKSQDSGLKRFVKCMRKVYELGMKRDSRPTAMKEMSEWNKHFRESIDDPFIKKYSLTLKHVLLASEAFLQFKEENFSEATSSVEEANKYLHEEDFKATICGLKAFFLSQYGIKGHEAAVPLAREAVEFCPDEEWIYILAKNLRDTRRSELYNTDNTKNTIEEELQLFQWLSELWPKPVYLIRLGNTYHDKAMHFKCTRNYNSSAIQRYCQDGVNLFEDALKLNIPKMKTYLRIIRGVNNIPHDLRYRYKNLSSSCVEEILKMINDDDDDESVLCGVYFAVGKYYQNLEKDKDKAKHFFEKAKSRSLNAQKELIIFKYESDPSNYNPYQDIRNKINAYPDKPKKLEGLCQIVSYNLFIKEDLLEAVKVFKEVIQEEPSLESLYIKKHKSWFQKSGHINLLHTMKDKVLSQLETKGYRTQQEKDILLEFINLLPEENTKVYVNSSRKKTFSSYNGNSRSVDRETSYQQESNPSNFNKCAITNWRAKEDGDKKLDNCQNHQSRNSFQQFNNAKSFGSLRCRGNGYDYENWRKK